MSTTTVITKIRSASREIVRQLGLLENKFASIGSVSQCHAIVELHFQGKMNLNQLSEALNLEKSTTSRLVMQLEEDGICNLETGRSDRRNKIISITQKGADLVQQINAESNKQVKQALQTLSEEERNMVVVGLTLYAQALKNTSNL